MIRKNTARDRRIRDGRWYCKNAYGALCNFIKEYKFGFVPKSAVNISASSASPINEILGKTYQELQIVNTYRGEVDIKQMPYENNSTDVLISEMVLEHVSQVWEAPPEIYRILRVGGITIQLVPFMYPEHGKDYYRFTKDGLKDLFCEFEVLEVGCSGCQEIANFLLMYRSKHPKLKEFKEEALVSKQIISEVGLGSFENLCSNCVWGIFRKRI